jgi:hypothetical protein
LAIKPEGKNHLIDIGIDGRIILKWILGKSGGRVQIIHFTQDRYQTQALWSW